MTPSDQNIADAKRKAASYSTAGIKNERDQLRETNADWLAANAPGGWIDNLRVINAELIAALQYIELSTRHNGQWANQAVCTFARAALAKAQSCAP